MRKSQKKQTFETAFINENVPIVSAFRGQTFFGPSPLNQVIRNIYVTEYGYIRVLQYRQRISGFPLASNDTNTENYVNNLKLATV